MSNDVVYNKRIFRKVQYVFFDLSFRSHVEAAEYFGVSNSFIKCVYKGKCEPTAEMLAKAGYYKVDDGYKMIDKEALEERKKTRLVLKLKSG